MYYNVLRTEPLFQGRLGELRAAPCAQKHSASIGLYRYQAKYFDGQPDGKIEVVLKETKHFQAITNAGNN
jgi:hypothetical protein